MQFPSVDSSSFMLEVRPTHADGIYGHLSSGVTLLGLVLLGGICLRSRHTSGDMFCCSSPSSQFGFLRSVITSCFLVTTWGPHCCSQVVYPVTVQMGGVGQVMCGKQERTMETDQ